MPSTRTGTGCSRMLAGPSRPKNPPPAPHTVPSSSRYSVCPPPGTTALMFLRPTTGTGRCWLTSTVPLPTCPKALRPQETAVPSSRSATTGPLPDSTVRTPSRPGTGAGLGRLSVVPSPSWPFELSPHALTISVIPSSSPSRLLPAARRVAASYFAAPGSFRAFPTSWGGCPGGLGNRSCACGISRVRRTCGPCAREVARAPLERQSSREAPMRWIVHGERSVYASEYMQLCLSDVEIPDGERYEHHLIRLPRSVGMLVHDAARRVLMVWRHRFTTDTWNWELPGGWVDPGETRGEAAGRETEEETGWRPGDPSELAYIQPCAGITDAEQFLYASSSARYLGPPRHGFESDRVAWIPLADVPGMIARKEIVGGVSLIGLLHLLNDTSTAIRPAA